MLIVGVERSAVCRMLACGKLIPSGLRNREDQAPAAHSTALVLM